MIFLKTAHWKQQAFPLLRLPVKRNYSREEMTDKLSDTLGTEVIGMPGGTDL